MNLYTAEALNSSDVLLVSLLVSSKEDTQDSFKDTFKNINVSGEHL